MSKSPSLSTVWSNYRNASVGGSHVVGAELDALLGLIGLESRSALGATAHA